MKTQIVVNNVKKNPNLNGIYEVVAESGAIYLTKDNAKWTAQIGNAVEIEYNEVRKPKQNGGEWVNNWVVEPKKYNGKGENKTLLEIKEQNEQILKGLREVFKLLEK